MPDNPFLTFFYAEAESGRATPRSLAFGYAILRELGAVISRSEWPLINEAVEGALNLRSAQDIDAFRRMAGEIRYAANYRATQAVGFVSGHVHDAPGAVQ